MFDITVTEQFWSNFWQWSACLSPLGGRGPAFGTFEHMMQSIQNRKYHASLLVPPHHVKVPLTPPTSLSQQSLKKDPLGAESSISLSGASTYIWVLGRVATARMVVLLSLSGIVLSR
ncbi:hypothetical protein CY34DRAFT_374734 [Suillus luteus UH-Slu-Lm8-n1]|uniref:Uncharacterized protein n=1 Tax=Suillus luteus UH-Slu-Lm8-n1 TaxID=930992 RepID=A0A0D0AKP3_9AGAM|nr:hypothetical protein CY34DRAFT_374734 [Suillus luteus UH-Slu-Lm8-n1]